MDATITGLTTQQAYLIADTLTDGGMRSAQVVGSDEDEVRISREGLDELAALDGFDFDGRSVWIGNETFPVRGL